VPLAGSRGRPAADAPGLARQIVAGLDALLDGDLWTAGLARSSSAAVSGWSR